MSTKKDNNEEPVTESTQVQPQITSAEFIRRKGIDKRNSFAAGRIFGNKTATEEEWQKAFIEHKLITE